MRNLSHNSVVNLKPRMVMTISPYRRLINYVDGVIADNIEFNSDGESTVNLDRFTEAELCTYAAELLLYEPNLEVLTEPHHVNALANALIADTGAAWRIFCGSIKAAILKEFRMSMEYWIEERIGEYIIE